MKNERKVASYGFNKEGYHNKATLHSISNDLE